MNAEQSLRWLLLVQVNELCIKNSSSKWKVSFCKKGPSDYMVSVNRGIERYYLKCEHATEEKYTKWV